MQQNDVTQAVLLALARAYPQPMQAEALARAVSCDEEALRRLLRVLSAVGAVAVCVAGAWSSGHGGNVAITDAALNLLRHRI
ncbi:MAG TPA: hypothetical protein VF169_02425 [Albitalea sp.]|uniref:hypothetical protein n=1 Tax=Piscinibacter sp. TaxID=1903157 RepID=UPI002ED2F622